MKAKRERIVLAYSCAGKIHQVLAHMLMAAEAMNGNLLQRYFDQNLFQQTVGYP